MNLSRVLCFRLTLERMRSLAKTLVTKSIRSSTKKTRSLLRKLPGRSARFVSPPSRYFQLLLTRLRLFSALLLPNLRSQLPGLRGVSPHRPRSRLLSPSRRMTKSKHPDPMPFMFTIPVLVSCFLWFAKYHTTVSRYLSTFQTNIGDYIVLSQLHYISQTDTILTKVTSKRSVEVPLVCFPPRFVSIFLDDVL